MVGGFSGVYASGPSSASHGTQRVESMIVDVENRFRTVRTFYPKRCGGLHWLSNAEPPELARRGEASRARDFQFALAINTISETRTNVFFRKIGKFPQNVGVRHPLARYSNTSYAVMRNSA